MKWSLHMETKVESLPHTRHSALLSFTFIVPVFPLYACLGRVRLTSWPSFSTNTLVFGLFMRLGWMQQMANSHTVIRIPSSHSSARRSKSSSELGSHQNLPGSSVHRNLWASQIEGSLSQAQSWPCQMSKHHMMLQMSFSHENTMDICSQVSQRLHYLMCFELKKEFHWLNWSHSQAQTWLDQLAV